MTTIPKIPARPTGVLPTPPVVKIEEDVQVVSSYEKLLAKNDKQKEVKEEGNVRMENFFETAKNNLKQFDERARKQGKGYKIPNYPMIDQKLEGLSSGLYVFAGESNSGKSAAMMNLMKDICSYDDNYLFGIYYSLDDTKDEIIPRIIAMEQEIPIGVAAKPVRYEEMLENGIDDNSARYAEFLEKREKGLDKLYSEADKLLIEDSNKIKNSSDIENHIKLVKTFLKSYYIEHGDAEKAEKMNVIIAIDALNDIKLDPKVFGRVAKDESSEEVAKFTKNLSVKFDIPVFVSSHLRKLNGNRRPTLDDLREANTLVYEASVVWLVYNDVSKNKSGAKVFWNDNSEVAPILEMDWAKNKKSSYKGRTFNLFRPNWSQIKECSKNDMDRYEQIILQS